PIPPPKQNAPKSAPPSKSEAPPPAEPQLGVSEREFRATAKLVQDALDHHDADDASIEITRLKGMRQNEEVQALETAVERLRSFRDLMTAGESKMKTHDYEAAATNFKEALRIEADPKAQREFRRATA